MPALLLGWELVRLVLLGRMKGGALLNLPGTDGHLLSHGGQLDLIFLTF